MLNNTGTYGSNEPPNDMIASINRTQSISSKSNHNMNSFGKIGQQVASCASGNYEAHNFHNFGQPPMNAPPIMHPYQAYQTMGHTSSYLPQNFPYAHENHIQDYFPAVSTIAQTEHHNNMLDFHQNIQKTTEIQAVSNNETINSGLIKVYPLNIPQIPRKFQKSPIFDKNALYNPENVTQNNTTIYENTPVLTEAYHKTCNTDISRINSPENLTKSTKILSEHISEVPPSIIESNDLETPRNLSQNYTIPSENKPQSSTTVIQKNFTSNIDDNNSNDFTKLSESTSMPSEHSLSERKRKSLEKTVRLIESILIKSTNNNKSNIIENTTIEVDPLAFSPKPNSTSTNTDDSETEYSEGKSDSDDDDKLPSKCTRKDSKEMSPSKKIHSTRRSHVIETETEVQFERRMKLEIDDVDVKVEHMSWPDIDFLNPFQRDCNGVMTKSAGDVKVINMENSVGEALATLKSGSQLIAYFECPHCSLLLTHPKRFLVHTKWHTFGLLNKQRAEIARERENKAREKREARTMQRLGATEATGDEEKTFPCKDCDKVFQTRSSLKNHRRKFHATKVTECRICLEPVPGLKALRAHMNTHEDKEAGVHQCPHCPKRFKYRHSLAKHADTHLEKTHACPECSKMFGSVQLVKMHMKTHERAARGTTYHCSYCAKGFYEPYNLNVHERTHRNDKPYKCDICESCFVTNSSLKRHVKVSHSGAKPHTCPVCQKCFSTASIRDRHELRVHSDQEQFPHQCQLCPRRYMKPKDLRNHMYKMHPKEKKKNNITEEPVSS